MPKKLEEGQIVLCTVTKIVGTIVFVKIEEYNFEGTITFAEIFPGKIRNIRDFVFPGKKVVCKILRINPHVIELSLRRVKVNERNDFNDRFKREKSYAALFKTILGEAQANEAISKIKEKEISFFDLIESSKEKPELLAKYVSKENAEKIISILKEKKSKETVLTKKFSLSSKASNGIVAVKELIKETSKNIDSKTLEISYIAAGKFMIKIRTKDLKKGDSQIRKMMSDLDDLAKKRSCVFLEEKD